jgi:2-keto-3-deoxy-6-phosphogluconate aldolase
LVPTNGITAATIRDYIDAGAVAVGVGGEVFPEGFTLEHVESAARRIRQAMDAARPAR